MQWLGGIGIIVMAITILPLLKVGGMQLFKMEGADSAEKILPRTIEVATIIIATYLVLTFLCGFFYWRTERLAILGIKYRSINIWALWIPPSK